ncbi:MAG: FG-GAP repeat protein [Phycisphaerales bacterium]|nr:MAG: FG-GAP repeat protein [Phycisphaerales bacterium]
MNCEARHNGTTWSQQAKLVASDGAEYDEFGHSVSILGDSVVVGAPHDDDHGNVSGSAYVFMLNGTDWNERENRMSGSMSGTWKRSPQMPPRHVSTLPAAGGRRHRIGSPPKPPCPRRAGIAALISPQPAALQLPCMPHPMLARPTRQCRA